MRVINRDIAGAFIFSSDGKVLLGKSTQGGAYEDLWVVPGGGIEPGESKLEALKREIKEELGLNLEDSQIEPITTQSQGQSEKDIKETGERALVKMTFWDFKVTLSQPADQVKFSLDDDLSEAKFFTMNELPKLKLGGGTSGSLKRMGYL